MILEKKRLLALIARWEKKAQNAEARYQETGERRYCREKENAEDMADALRMAANAEEDYSALVHTRGQLAAYQVTGMTPEKIVRLKTERDAAVQELREMCVTYGDTCNRCAHKRSDGIDCYFPDEQEDADDKICRMCDSGCPCGHCDGESKWEWRGPQTEQVLAPADQSAGEYADNPVLAQA